MGILINFKIQVHTFILCVHVQLGHQSDEYLRHTAAEVIPTSADYSEQLCEMIYTLSIMLSSMLPGPGK